MNRSIHKIIDDQMKRWEMSKTTRMPASVSACSVITISRECGSRGQEVAEKLAASMGYDLFHHEILETMIHTTKNSRVLLETLDEKGMNIVEDLVADLVHEHHLWPDEYSKILLRIMNTIGKHGRAVILGRGGSCALKKITALKIRLVAPASMRLDYIQHTRDLNREDAEKLMVSTDANRTAFVRRYFNCDAEDPANYDLILNTGSLSVDRTVQVIRCAMGNT